MNYSTYQQGLVSACRQLANSTGLRRRRRVIFAAPTDFHLDHLMPVIEEVRSDRRLRPCLLAMPDLQTVPELEGVDIVDYDRFMKRGRWKFFDLIVTTEFWGVPWWFTSGARAFVNHGVGPKKDYLDRLSDGGFTHVFAAGQTTRDDVADILAQSNARGTEIVDIGLPSTDSLEAQGNARRKEIYTGRPTLLYAPSWHVDPALIPMDEEILTQLGDIPSADVVIRPHPNLLKPERCGGLVWQSVFDDLARTGCEISLGTPMIDDLCRADVILGDISSVLYEFLFFDRPGMLYVPEDVFNTTFSADSRERLTGAYHRMGSANELPGLLADLLTRPDPKAAGRQKLMAVTFFNPGHAAEAAAKAVSDIVFS
tara:strand:+ start:391 stop:1497 length:1107 start_codon:yes stop_codon:yes gene_type:complete